MNKIIQAKRVFLMMVIVTALTVTGCSSAGGALTGSTTGASSAAASSVARIGVSTGSAAGASSSTGASSEAESSAAADSSATESSEEESADPGSESSSENEENAADSGEGDTAESGKEDTADSEEEAASEADALYSPQWVQDLPSAQDEKVSQLFIVAAMGTDKTTASVSMHERDADGKWTQILSAPGYVGSNGLCADEAHEEGCGQTPMGVYGFNKAFGIEDDPGCDIEYTKVTEDMYWSGDQNEGMHYNEMVSIKDLPELDTDRSEHIIDYTDEYKYCLNISFNEDGTPGRGSAIFLHCLGAVKPYTGGCVAIPENVMKSVMQSVKEDCVVVIDTLENMGGDLNAPLRTAEESAAAEEDVKLSADSSGFTLLTEAVPDAILEIRYYSTYNFVGERIDGYEEPLAMLTKEAAAALKKASDSLMEKGYRLKIYDAYRPQSAVTHFVNWAKDTEDTKMKEFFYPELEKDVLFPQGYIAEHSGHSRGSTVDLTLFDMTTEKEVDMGGTFDYFGELSHPDYKEITDEQYENRMLLRDEMIKAGFDPLKEEWWHFTLKDEPYPDTYFTFPVNSDSLKEGGAKETVSYAEEENWAYYGVGENKDADLFLICHTVDMKDEYNMAIDDEETKEGFLGALNMERGIYEESTRMFAPYYRQAAMKVYGLPHEEWEPYLELAYSDVSAAFSYYLEHENDGRPIILAGFSQGADMCYRLLEEYFDDEELYDQLVAVYAIGWPYTEEMTKAYPQIKPAKGADDTGVVISFDCEAEEVEETIFNRKGMKAYAINPLNWKTDDTPAEKKENLGACFTDYSGKITKERKALCGCYIDTKRGVLKVTDIDAADYPPVVPGLTDGAYHIYDYQFFFRNLQENVKERTLKYLEAVALDDAA